MNYRPLFFKNNALYLLDQKALPAKLCYRRCDSARDVACAIRDMTVRGAPLIGQAAAWGWYLDLARVRDRRGWGDAARRAARGLGLARPPARNLKARLELLQRRFGNEESTLLDKKRTLKKFLLAQETEWENITAAMARHGSGLLRARAQVLTHCNTGRLATLGRGTAFAVIDEAHRQGKLKRVFACETRPYLQGMRLTMWELGQAGIPSTLITDGMAAYLMSKKNISAVLVGADRVAANGDTANKIGTLSLALAAKHYGVSFYVVCPEETIDRSLGSGRDIVVEERSTEEVVVIAGRRLAPPGISVWHPAFDVTPHDLISAVVTEKGVWRFRG